MKAVDLPKLPWQHLCVYGDPKVGKSTLVAELAEAGYKLIIFSTDGGYDVIYKLSPEALGNIEVFAMQDTRDHPIAINTSRRILDGKRYSICDIHGRIDCKDCKSKGKGFSFFSAPIGDPKSIVILDHISGMAESAMNLAFKAIPGSAIKKDLEKELDLSSDDISKQEWDHHRMQGQLMDGILKQVEHAKFHVICLAHMLEVTMEDKSKKYVPQIGSAPFSSTGGKYFTSIILMELKNGKHRAGSSTTYKAGYLTGSRTDIEIEKEDTPTLLPFFRSKDTGVSSTASISSSERVVTDGGGSSSDGEQPPEGLSKTERLLWIAKNRKK